MTLRSQTSAARLLAFTAAAAAATGVAAQGHRGPDLQHVCAYYVCSDLAKLRPLGAGEAAACSMLYQQLKRSFLADPAPVASGQHAGRAAASRRGYVALQEWQADNPDLVAELRRAAARQLAGETVCFAPPPPEALRVVR